MTPTRPEWLQPTQLPRHALAQLLERPDAAKLVRATPAQPLFLFIKALGLEESLDLLALCSTEQVQAFLDMDVWDRDRLNPSRMFPWMAALCELGPSKLAVHVRRLDPELMTSFLGPRVRVYEIADEEAPPPEEPQGSFYESPDRFYLVDILPDPDGNPDHAGELQRFFDQLYRGDLELGRSILQSACWDAGTETEESAQRFRSGRMADLGYIDYYEALKVYMLLDPQAPGPPSELGELANPKATPPPTNSTGLSLRALPGFDAVDCIFVRAASALSDAEQGRLIDHLLLLSNRVMSADRVELGDAVGARRVLHRIAGYLSLGLEFRLRPSAEKSPASGPSDVPQTLPELRVDAAQAATVLRSVSLLQLFRLGYSLTVQLRKLASLLVAGHEHALTTLLPQSDPASLLPLRLAEPLRNLLLVRPLYSGYLDAPPAAGLTPPRWPQEVPSPRPFLSLRDLARAAAFLGELPSLGRFLTVGLGLRHDNLNEVLKSTAPTAADAQLADLLGTMVANLLLERPPVFVPLSRQDLPALRLAALGEAELGPGKLRPSVEKKLRERLLTRLGERALGEPELALMWTAASQLLLDETLLTLATSLGNLPPELDGATADAVPRLAGLVMS